MPAWVWIVIAVVVVVVLVVIAVAAVRRRRSAELQQRFGQEYARTLDSSDGRRSAEADLRNRQKQREQLMISPLPDAARARYAEQWRELQERFIDQPASAVVAADALVQRVMGDEGYPIHDFSAQAALVSVDHPQVVENYRVAHDICQRTQTQQASTEDMRTALLRYRSLFDELLSRGMDEGAANNTAPLPNQHPPGQHRMG